MPANLAVLANVCFLLVYGSIRTKTFRASSLIVLAWIAANVAYVYIQYSAFGASNPYFGPLHWPYFAVLGVSASLLAFKMAKGVPVTYVWLLMFAVVYWLGLNATSVDAIASIANQADAPAISFLYYCGISLAFWVSLLTPLAIFSEPGSRPWKTFGLVDFSGWRRHRPVIIKGALAFIFVLLVSNVYFKSMILPIHFLWPPMTLLIGTLLLVFYEVMIRHFVCLGFTSLIVKKVLGDDDEGSWIEVVFLALLYAAMYYDAGWAVITSEFSFGLVLAYLYVRTKSLSYGLIMCSFARVFMG